MLNSEKKKMMKIDLNIIDKVLFAHSLIERIKYKFLYTQINSGSLEKTGKEKI